MSIAEISERLIVDGFLAPTRIGPKHEIYSKTFPGSLAQEILDESSSVTTKAWKGGISHLLEILDAWAGNSALVVFRVAVHDSSFSEVLGLSESVRPDYILKELAWLQTLEISDSPITQVCLASTSFDWMIVFERGDGITISCYSSEQKWGALLCRMQSDDSGGIK